MDGKDAVGCWQYMTLCIAFLEHFEMGESKSGKHEESEEEGTKA